MKSLYYAIILAGFCLSALVSCTEYTYPEEQLPEIPVDSVAGLKVSAKNIYIEASGDARGMEIYALGGDWTVKALDAADWLLKIEPDAGGDGNTVVGVELAKNEGMQERTCRLLVSQEATGQSDTVVVKQYTHESKYSRLTDSLALVAVYKALNGAEWAKPWKFRYPMDTWQGVTLGEVNGEMRVVKFAIPTFKVTSSLPNELGELKELRELIIKNSEFQGRVPNSLASLRKLERLAVDFSENVSWYLPDMSKLISLHYMSVGALNIDMESMGELWNVTGLDTLIMTGFNTQGAMPAGISRVSGLKHIDWSGTRISALPEDIGGLKELQYLNLKNCSKLAALPESIGELSALKYLDIYSGRALTYIPESLGRLAALEVLDLSYCAVLKHLPSTLGNLKKLKKLSFGNCEALMDLPENIGNLSGVTELSFSNCKSLTRLPESLASLQLSSLNFESCSNLMTLPESIGNMTTLEELRLNYCTRFNALPAGIGSLPKLRKMELYSTALTTLPAELGQLPALEVLVISAPERAGEGINGVAADLFGGLTSLTELRVSGHNFTGGIDWLLNLEKLTKVNLSGNRLSGTIAEELLNAPRWTTWQPKTNIYPQQDEYGFLNILE